ncbi:aminoglycoside phosphotransferase family protein [Deinococcus sp. MIMF12]|uniref:Aminoglycoside phosphotransferase family protein n=1 Tax=Deinococcus rhizophilus TaxID=3049544 RepID=A0ABT7JJF7_9DEIO|nr:aminoglycoside phosphotransferase family protein [Deinococcus rhizophilus]MDL2344732.1 aminoglycoside phosphotransferase family protein [Deinococcus rhizophilus]
MDDSLFLEVEPTVRAYAGSLGAPGQQWLDSLPGAVERQCRDWELQRGEALTGGSRSYVCRVTGADGGRAVLKLALPEPALETQISTLLAARGHGYVRVLRHDPGRGALLLEALGPSAEKDHDLPAALALTAATLKQAWQVPPGRCALPGSTEHRAASLLTLIRDLAGEDREIQAAVRQALRYAHERYEARDPARQVLVHGDPHVGNLLRVEAARPGAETGYVFVDPEGFLCEPEYDLGVALRGWNSHLLASDHPRSEVRGWCDRMARATGTDPEAVWQWTVLVRVSTGLYLRHHGLPDPGARYLEAAARLLA